MALIDELLQRHGRERTFWENLLGRCGIPPSTAQAGLSLRQRRDLGQALRQLTAAEQGEEVGTRAQELSLWARRALWQWLRARRPWLLQGGVAAAQAEWRRSGEAAGELADDLPLPERDPRWLALRQAWPVLDLPNLAVCAFLDVAVRESRLAAVLRRAWPGLPPQQWPLQGIQQIVAPHVRDFAQVPAAIAQVRDSRAGRLVYLVRASATSGPDRADRAVGSPAAGPLAASRGLLSELPPLPSGRIPLVFSPELRGALAELALRWQHRGAAALGSGGQVALLAGPEGHGRRTAAREAAEAMGIRLLRVQPALLGSRWIGESEQRISQMFRQAAQSGCGLLIDDAHDLLTGRVAVQTAGDRYANTASNHMLQEIERFSGLVLLVAQGPHQFDAAMRRRIQVVVRFPPPDLRTRQAIVAEALEWLGRRDRLLAIDPELDATELALGALTPAQLVRAVLGAAMTARRLQVPLDAPLLQEQVVAEVRQSAGVVRGRVDLQPADR
ncbi:MAG: ATP-binding protein [Deltaproteobacteria bacterium]|nr:ATP-binding protein [Deltaproteobacteria bacterium]